jgi:serine/threonine protein kinase
MSMSHDRFGTFSDEQLDQVDAACSELESAWKRGEAVRIEQWYEKADPVIQRYLLRELIAAEVEQKRVTGLAPEIDDYESRFPEHLEEIRTAFGFSTETAANSTAAAMSSRPWAAKLPVEFGRYQLQQLLGRGGMGSVYLARDRELGRLVAIKFPTFDDRPAVRQIASERFHREARSMATVQHANVCPIYDVGELDGDVFLTMSYIEGQSLSGLIAEHKRLEPKQAISIALSLAKAIQAVHKQGVYHRDIKPSNVMLRADGEPILMDFGLASRTQEDASNLTHSGLVIGSPAYMAPEQIEARHSDVGPQTDIYALGIILYEMLCGRRPYEGSNLSVLGQVSSRQPIGKPSDVAGLPEPFDELCLKCLSFDIADRYQSADELITALETILQPVEETKEPRIALRNSSKQTVQKVMLTSCLIVLVAAVWYSLSPPQGIQEEQTQASNGKTENEDETQISPKNTLARITDDPVLQSQGKQLSVALQATARLLPPVQVPSQRSDGRLFDSGQRLGQSFTSSASYGDVDGDGDLDVLTTVTSPEYQSVLWENDGTGLFPKSKTFPHGSHHGKLGDLNADGHLDLFLSSKYKGCSVWLNNGEGEFNLHTELPEFPSKMFALGDLDGDNDLDVFQHSSERDRGNLVLINDGAAKFRASDQRFGVQETLGIALADFDDDGDLDAYCANWGGPNRIWLNDGTGTFSDSGEELGHSNSIRVAVGDLDADGDIDACVTNNQEQTRIWQNDGEAHFEGVIPSAVKMPSVGVALADFDGDGGKDILIGNGDVPDGPPLSPNQLLLSNGKEKWTSEWIGAGKATAFTVADFDGDGVLDVYVGNGHREPDQVWLSSEIHRIEKTQHELRFIDSGQRLGQFSSMDVELVDVDNDHDLDAVVANGGPQTPNNIWLNDGTGIFKTSRFPLGNESCMDLGMGDLDGDGDVDAFVACIDSPSQIWLNDGMGKFTQTEQSIGEIGHHVVELGDFDLDGDLDAWCGNRDEYSHYIWFNNGDGSFSKGEQLISLEKVWALHAMDADGDGDLDMLVGTDASHPNSIWLNNGKGTFRISESKFSGITVSNGFATGDLNGDSFPDIYECGDSASDRIWFGIGDGKFKRSSQEFPSMSSRGAQIADLDNDGDLDVFVPQESSNPNMILTNDGTGKFTEAPFFMGDNYSSNVALGDLDQDGDLDALVVNNHREPNRVWRNEK